jgi:hypothetical protein
VLAVTILIVPSLGLYNQVLLIPSFLVLCKEWRVIWQASVVNRILCFITIGLIGWPWISALGLAGLSFVMARETVERAWAIPLWTALQPSLTVAALMLLHYYQRTFTAPARAGSS